MKVEEFAHHRRKLSEASLNALNISTSQMTGEDFFKTLVEQMAKALEVTYVLAGRLITTDEGEAIETIAVWANDQLAANLVYQLDGTPCQNVSAQNMCFHPCDIQTQYPQDKLLEEMEAESYIGMPMISTHATTLGILVALDTKPMNELTHYHALSLLSIFATRCAAELQHQDRNRQLSEMVEQRSAELIEARKQLEEKQRLASLGAMVAGVSHEINTPLGVVMTAASSLQEKVKHTLDYVAGDGVTRIEMQKQLRHIDKLTTVVQRNMLRTIELMGHFKQVALEEHNKEAKDIDVKAYLEAIVETQGALLRERQIRCEVNCPAELSWPTQADLITHIFTNLIQNSCRHGFDRQTPHGRITIGGALVDGQLVLNYHDNGCGVGEEELGQLFEPFYTTDRGRGGSGLGLHIVYNAVSKLGGTIDVHNDDGLAFFITLPKLAMSQS